MIVTDAARQEELRARLNAEADKAVAGEVSAEDEAKPNDNWETGVVMLSSEIGFRVAPVLHGDLVALAFQVTYNGSSIQASTILPNGQTLVMRLPDAGANGRTRLVLIKPRIVRRANGFAG